MVYLERVQLFMDANTVEQVIRVKKLVGLPPPALELLASYSVRKRILCTCTHTHTHIQPTKNIPYTHVAVDTNIVVFRPSEPHQYSINILHKCTRWYTRTHTNINIIIVCLYTVYSHTHENCHKYTHPYM